MSIPDSEDLFHFFFRPDDYDSSPAVGLRIRSNKFRTRGHTLSFNRASIWPLERHFEVARTTWGICSVNAGELRGVYLPEHDNPPESPKHRGPIDIDPDPYDEDPLLGIPNPSHASVNRLLNAREAERLAAHASTHIHRPPGVLNDQP